MVFSFAWYKRAPIQVLIASIAAFKVSNCKKGSRRQKNDVNLKIYAKTGLCTLFLFQPFFVLFSNFVQKKMFDEDKTLVYTVLSGEFKRKVRSAFSSQTIRKVNLFNEMLSVTFRLFKFLSHTHIML